MRYDNEALRDAVAQCRAAERALEEAQLHYRRAQEKAAFLEEQRVRADIVVNAAQSALLAFRAEETAAVAVLTAVLEDQAPYRRPQAPPASAGEREPLDRPSAPQS
ncbi:hypothetical protein ACFYVL_21290 [Streptomyces sp. NPDC004111]|uniref:hypothetical protein n=1 Tax=Streptomyces sp. NPDC004111 TaxID=3364690 RepID=UPI0036AE538E